MIKEPQSVKPLPANQHFWVWLALYVTGYALLIHVFDAKSRIIEVPVLYYIACNYGRWNALAAGILSVPLNLALFYIVGGQEVLATLDSRYWLISAGLIFMFYEIGYSHELRRNLDEELRRSRSLAAELASERDRVQRSNEAKEALLLSISHDLRSPLSAMIQSAQLMAADPHHVQRHADLIQRTGHQLLRVVNDLLRGFRQEEGASSVPAEAFDLHRLLSEVVELHAPLFADKGLQLSLVRDDALPIWAVGHVLQLRRILVNLLGNSLKYTANGGATLEAKLSAEDSAEQLHLIVRDTGCGIPVEQIAALMNAVREKPNPRINGSEFSYGLGLGNCLRMSKAIGGKLQLLPNRPQGLQAIVQLPLVRGEPPVSLANRDRHYLLPDLPCPTLIIDDDSTGAETLSAMLEQLSCSSHTAVDARAALVAAKMQRFALGFIDQQLPDADGVNLIGDLRRIAPDATLVLFSANILLNDFGQWLNPDIDLILSKPIELHELAQLCRRADGKRCVAQIEPEPVLEAIEKRHRVLMHDYLKQALAAYCRQDYAACARELHRLSSASGTLRLLAVAESARRSELAARQASRIALFSALRELIYISSTALSEPAG